MSEIGAFDHTVRELLPVRDELRTVTNQVSPREKNEFLESIGQPSDALYPVVLMNSSLQTLAGGLRRLHDAKAHINAVRPSLRIAESRLKIPSFDELTKFGDRIFDLDDLLDGLKFGVRDHDQIFRKIERELTHLAHKAAGETDSYRRYEVGCMGYYTDEHEERVAILSSSNSKPHDLAPKYCAERVNLDKAHALGFTRTIGLVIFGTPQEDQDSGMSPETTHPCHSCREEIATNPVVPEDTIIICTNQHGTKQEEFTPDELMTYHKHTM